jgi:gluconolactonase
MTGPTVQWMASQDEKVALEGYTLDGPHDVRIDCKQLGTRVTAPVDTTTSTGDPLLALNGGSIHGWSTSVEIPASCWVPVAPGVAATRVYAIDLDEDLRMVHVEDVACAVEELDAGAVPGQAGYACAERFAHRELRAPSGLPTDQDPLAGAGAVELLATGFGWAEGPLWDADEEALVFTDVEADAILQLESGILTTVEEGTGAFANGLDFDASGERLECHHGQQQVIRRGPGGVVTVVADAFQGAPFNSPNDAIAHESGAIFFTDPTYGSLPNLGGVAPQQPWQGVYRVELDTGVVTLVDDGLVQPNGIALSPDHATLYVTDSVGGVVMQYPVSPGGNAGAGSVLAYVQAPDGMAVDVNGNLYVAASSGVVVLRPDGSGWGTIALPEAATNVAFGDEDRRSLYVTTPGALHRVVLGVPGAPASF